MAKAKKLFTIGYEQTPSKAVLDELQQAGVKLLVDVRAVASSRRPGFSKSQLAAGQGRARRARRAGEKSRPGLPALLRARPQQLPPAMDRRDH